MEPKKKHRIDEEILNTFWNLAETDEEKRISGLETLIKALLLKQVDNETEPCAEVDYTVKRLIKGLASNRGCARLGFSLALEQILKRFPFYKIPHLLKLVESNLKYQKSDTKAEVSQIFIGKLMAFGSIIRAFEVKEVEVDVLVKFMHVVLNVGKKKSFLGQITLEIFYGIMSKFNKHEFKENIWPLIEKDMCQGWLIEAMSTTDMKSHGSIKEGSELLLAWGCMDVIRGTDRLSEEKQPHNMQARTKWAVSTLVSLVGHAAITDPKWLLHLMQFFVLGAFFDIQEADSEILHCESKFAVPVSKELRTLLKGGFVKALGKVADANSGKLASVKGFTEFLFNLSVYIQSLMDSSSISSSVNLTDDDQNNWNRAQQTVKMLYSQNVEGQANLSEGFKLLLLHQGLLIFMDQDDSRENLEDILNCHERAFLIKNKKPSKKSSEAAEPMWIDVLVDVLMHLLVQESHLTRNIVKMASLLLHPLYSLTSVQLITKVLDSEKGSDIGFENNDGDVDDEAENNEADEDMASEEDGKINNDEDDEDVGSDEEDAAMETEDAEGQVDPEFRDRIKAALGDAFLPSDAEDSVSDLDDDAMMKIDEMWADVMRQRTDKAKKKKELKEQDNLLMLYKLRCLDLVEDVARFSDSASMLYELVMPLLKLTRTCLLRKEFKDIGQRARKILQELFHRHKLKHDKILSMEELNKTVVQIQTTAKAAGLTKDVAEACIFMVRLAFGLENGASGERSKNGQEDSVESIVNSFILHFLKEKNSKMQPMFVQLLIEKYPKIVWSLKEELLGYVLSSEVRDFKRTSACVLLTTLVKQKEIKDLDIEEQFTAKLRMTVSKIIVDSGPNELKSRFAKQLLLLLIQLVSADKNRSTLEWPENFNEKLALLRKINKDVRSLCNQLTGMLQRNNSKRKNKKKKKNSEMKDKMKKEESETSNKMECDDISDDMKQLLLGQVSKSKRKRKSKKSRKSDIETTATVNDESQTPKSIATSSVERGLESDDMHHVAQIPGCAETSQKSNKPRKSDNKAASANKTKNQTLVSASVDSSRGKKRKRKHSTAQ